MRRHRGGCCAACGPALRVPILVFGALSVSDLNDVFDHGAHAHNLLARGRACAAEHRRRPRLPGGARLSAEDRHGYEPASASAMTTWRRTLPEVLRGPELACSRRSTRTSPPPTMPEHAPLRRAAVCASTAGARTGGEPERGPSACPVTPPIARPCCGTERDLAPDFVRPGPPPVRHRDRRPVSASTLATDARDVGHEPGRGRQGPAPWARASGYGWRHLFGRGGLTTVAVVPAGYADGLDCPAGGARDTCSSVVGGCRSWAR